MDQATKTKLTPRYVDGKAMIVAGMSERVTAETWDKIDKLWWRFAPHIGSVPTQVGARVAYGAVTDAGKGIEYMAAVEVADTKALPVYRAQAAVNLVRFDAERRDPGSAQAVVQPFGPSNSMRRRLAR